MKDPNISSNSNNMTISTEVILNNQFNSEENPFAEYMWMENEEEFNRQVRRRTWRPGVRLHTKCVCGICQMP